MSKLNFSGHDTFHCRQFWLKKGVDLKVNKKEFNDNAVLDLGVGRNMVTAIRFWLKAFDLVDENEYPNELAQNLFKDGGWDPFLEDEGTLWLLHYLLVTSKTSSIYGIIFSEFRKFKPEFNQDLFIKFIEREKGSFNENTLKKDFGVFQKTYLAKKDVKDLEESLSGLLTELNLVEEKIRDKKTYLSIVNKSRPEIPNKVILYAILKNPEFGQSISFNSFYNDIEGVGNIFALSENGLFEKIEEIIQDYQDITFINEAGIRELQFKGKKPNPMAVLKEYYEAK